MRNQTASYFWVARCLVTKAQLPHDSYGGLDTRRCLSHELFAGQIEQKSRRTS
jgi:hypothetical protein